MSEHKITVYTKYGTPKETAITTPATSTDNAIVRFDGTSGRALQDSGVIVPDGLTGDVVSTSGSQTLTNKTLTTPTIADFTNAQHDHTDADAGGLIPANTIVKYACVADVKSKNTNGGGSSAATWHTRTLNTELSDVDSIVSLSSNKFTLAAGEYVIAASAPAFVCAQHKAVIWNTTDSTLALKGQSEYSGATDGVQTRAWVVGRLSLAGTKDFELRHYITNAQATNGLGVATNVNDSGGTSLDELYAVVQIWKLGS